MLYAIIGEDVPDSLTRRLSVRPAHLERLQALQQAGRLLLAGPFPAIDGSDPGAAGFSGSLIVATVMNIPNIGPLLLRALQQQDMYLAGSILLIYCLLTIIGTLISDVLLAVADPRIRMEGGN